MHHLQSIHNLVILFFIFAVIGWIIETIYRSVAQEKFCNPGLLTGPYVPLYGFCGLLIMGLVNIMDGAGIAAKSAAYCAAITLIEYLAGEIVLFLFNRRLWDYRENRWNLRGHICPLFSLLWTILALFFEYGIYPVSLSVISTIPPYTAARLTTAILVILNADLLYSTGIAQRTFDALRGAFSSAAVRDLVRRLTDERIPAFPFARQQQLREIRSFLKNRGTTAARLYRGRRNTLASRLKRLSRTLAALRQGR